MSQEHKLPKCHEPLFGCLCRCKLDQNVRQVMFSHSRTCTFLVVCYTAHHAINPATPVFSTGPVKIFAWIPHPITGSQRPESNTWLFWNPQHLSHIWYMVAYSKTHEMQNCILVKSSGSNHGFTPSYVCDFGKVASLHCASIFSFVWEHIKSNYFISSWCRLSDMTQDKHSIGISNFYYY